MATATKEQVQKRVDEIHKLILDEKLLGAIKEASEDKQLLKQAKTDPRAFLRKRGVSVPRSLELKISGTVTICVRVCGRVGPVVICVEVCGSISF